MAEGFFEWHPCILSDKGKTAQGKGRCSQEQPSDGLAEILFSHA